VDRKSDTNLQGREIAHNIAKPKEQVAYTKIPIFWSSVGKGLRYLGTGAGFDDTYTDGDVNALKVSRGGVTAITHFRNRLTSVCHLSSQER